MAKSASSTAPNAPKHGTGKGAPRGKGGGGKGSGNSKGGERSDRRPARGIAKDPAARPGDKMVANNRRAFHDFHVMEKFEAGVALVGTEVKSLREGQCQLISAYAKLDPNPLVDEAWLLSVNIPEYRGAGRLFQHEPQRTRRLLLHKREIRKIRMMLHEKGTTLIPLSLYIKGGRIKVAIGVCRGKRHEDKREALKKRDDKRRIERVARR
jgi:SsrA-binding protein